MNIIEEHTSPDHTLRLIVTRDEDDDITIGFDGYSWHTHGDMLAGLSGLPINEAVRQFVERLTTDEQIIAVLRVHGDIRDVWPADDPQGELKYQQPEEMLEFRRWSGIVVNINDP